MGEQAMRITVVGAILIVAITFFVALVLDALFKQLKSRPDNGNTGQT